MMRHTLFGTILSSLVLSGTLGCDQQGGGPAQDRIADLERQLHTVTSTLREAERSIAEMGVKLEQAEVDAVLLTTDLVKVKVARDQLKQEFSALQKRCAE